MSTSAVSSSGTTTAAGAPTAAQNASDGLTTADFLQLLTSEMQNQDPLNPVSNDQFLAELAQFTNLQETTGMASTLTTMSNTMQQTGSMAYLGQNVTLTDSNGNVVTGTVSQVGTTDGSPYVEVNGKQYASSTITSVNGKAP